MVQKSQIVQRGATAIASFFFNKSSFLTPSIYLDKWSTVQFSLCFDFYFRSLIKGREITNILTHNLVLKLEFIKSGDCFLEQVVTAQKELLA